MSITARQSTARTVMVGPVLDADGVAVTGAVVGDFLVSKNGGVPAALNGSATVTHRHTGHYSLALTTSDLDTVGSAQITLSKTTDTCPQKDITVVEEAIYDALFAVSATGLLPANVTQISGDSAAADNLEATYDGTGYANDYAPAQQQQMRNLSASGSPVNTAATGATITTGSQVGTFADTAQLDGVYHAVSDAAGTLDYYYEFNVGGDGVPTQAAWTGYLAGITNSLKVFARNWGAATWEQIGTVAGISGTTVMAQTFPLYTTHVGTGADLGKVRIRFQNTGLTAATLNVDRVYVSYAIDSRLAGYEDGAVWLDTVGGFSGTVSGYNGTVGRPSNTLANATTIATAVGLKSFELANGSSITLAQAYANYTFLGTGWTLALGGQAASGANFQGATVSGTVTGTAPSFTDCIVGAVTVPPCTFSRCGFTGTVTIGSAGTFQLVGCYDSLAGAGTPIIDFGAAVGATQVNVRKWSGGIEVRNMLTGDELSIDGHGRLIIAASCTGGTVIVHGNFVLTNNGSGQTITDTARFAEDQSLASITGSVGSISSITFPTNFGDLAITATTGRVTVGINADKTGYLISGTKTTLDALNDVSTLQVNAEVDTALADIHLDHLLAVDYDPAAKPGVATALLNELIESDAGVSRYTANALELAPTGGSAPTASQIADEVQTRTIAGVTLVTTTTNLTNAPTAGDFTATMKTSIGTAVAASPVASVTGNVGGNVVGTVGGIAGTTTTLDSLQTALSAAHGAGSWATATSVTVSDKTGFKLASDGLDAVLIESSITAGATLTDDAGTQLTSINARQALSLTISSLGGVLAGAATTNVSIKPAGKSAGNTRVDATVDSSGNRSALTLKVPT